MLVECPEKKARLNSLLNWICSLPPYHVAEDKVYNMKFDVLRGETPLYYGLTDAEDDSSTSNIKCANWKFTLAVLLLRHPSFKYDHPAFFAILFRQSVSTWVCRMKAFRERAADLTIPPNHPLIFRSNGGCHKNAVLRHEEKVSSVSKLSSSSSPLNVPIKSTRQYWDDFLILLDREQYCDMEVFCGDCVSNPVRCHSLVLASISQYVKSILFSTDCSSYSILLPDVDRTTFLKFIRDVYMIFTENKENITIVTSVALACILGLQSFSNSINELEEDNAESDIKYCQYSGKEEYIMETVSVTAPETKKRKRTTIKRKNKVVLVDSQSSDSDNAPDDPDSDYFDVASKKRRFLAPQKLSNALSADTDNITEVLGNRLEWHTDSWIGRTFAFDVPHTRVFGPVQIKNYNSLIFPGIKGRAYYAIIAVSINSHGSCMRGRFICSNAVDNSLALAATDLENIVRWRLGFNERDLYCLSEFYGEEKDTWKRKCVPAAKNLNRLFREVPSSKIEDGRRLEDLNTEERRNMLQDYQNRLLKYSQNSSLKTNCSVLPILELKIHKNGKYIPLKMVKTLPLEETDALALVMGNDLDNLTLKSLFDESGRQKYLKEELFFSHDNVEQHFKRERMIATLYLLMSFVSNVKIYELLDGVPELRHRVTLYHKVNFRIKILNQMITECTKVCPHCGKLFRGSVTKKDNAIASKHIRWCKNEKANCFCDISFKTPAQKRRHMLLVHSGDQHFQCDQCPFINKTQKGVDAHFSWVHGMPGVKEICDECGNFFNSKFHLSNHKAEKHIVRTCPHCKVDIIGRRTFKKHLLRVHQGGVTCSICGTVLKTQSRLEMHLKIQHQKNEL